MANIQWDQEQEQPKGTKIKVIGVGGGGCNAVADMVDKDFVGVDFYAVELDFQSLQGLHVPNKVQIGDDLTGGSGTGAQPSIGEQAARAAETQIKAMLEGCDMVFITAGMGGGTGTGAAPVIAEFARGMGILSVAIVTKPFTFEGPQRMRRAMQGISALRQHVDTMIVIMNDKLMEVVGPKTPIREAFHVCNSVLAQGIRAISDLVSKPGLINVDFRDVRTIMGETGGAVMGVGVGKGENRASEAVKKACHSPLQEKIVIDGARGVLINITGGADITMHEINEATSMVFESADPEADIIFGVVIDEAMADEMRVTIIATGFSETSEESLRRMSSREPRVRSRSIGMFEVQPEVSDEPKEPVAAKDPDPIPALQRKKEREVAQTATTPKIDFDRQDNPMKDWEMPSAKKPEAEEQAQPTVSARAAAPAFQDSQPQAQPAEEPANEDPYDIPAIQRRRRYHLFE